MFSNPLFCQMPLTLIGLLGFVLLLYSMYWTKLLISSSLSGGTSVKLPIAPSQFEAAFISDAHDRSHLEKALEMTESSFKKMAEK